MRRTKLATCGLLVAAALLGGGCGGGTPNNGGNNNDPDTVVDPVFSVALFSVASTQITNPYFPLRPGETKLLSVDGEDGPEMVIEEVLSTTRNVGRRSAGGT